MKQAFITAALLAVGVVGGCGNKKMAGVPQTDSVADISAPAPASYSQPIAQPVVYDTMSTSSTPSSASSGSMASGSYTVKHGDTLYSIARQRYGDGKQWTKISSANPGLQPQSLKVGQTIMIP